MRILIVEDDEKLCNVVRNELSDCGYIVDLSYSGADAIYYISQNIYDLIILDRMLPELDGLTLLKTIRLKGNTTPVLFTTALGEIHDKIDGLDAGADDYITKPYDMNELKARIRALLRRPQEITAMDQLTYQNLVLDLTSKKLWTEHNNCFLSKKESELLSFFMKNKEQILNREQILSRVWGPDNFVMQGNLDTYISFLRRRLKSVQSKAEIKTIHSVGYCLEAATCTSR